MVLYMHDAYQQPKTAKPMQHGPSQPTWTFAGLSPHGRERSPMQKMGFLLYVCKGLRWREAAYP